MTATSNTFGITYKLWQITYNLNIFECIAIMNAQLQILIDKINL